MRIIARFTKSEKLKYISHLDILRLFQKALRRAAIPVAYSGGFNPHMNICFACALPVGVSSDAEYIDMVLEEDINVIEIPKRLNAVLPIGIKILGAIELEKGFPSLTAITSLSIYTFYLPIFAEMTDLEDKLKSFMAHEDITIDKKSKSGNKLVNIRPMIHKLKLENGIITATLTAGNIQNLRADVFWNTLKAFLGIDDFAKINRCALYATHNEKVFEPIVLEGNL